MLETCSGKLLMKTLSETRMSHILALFVLQESANFPGKFSYLVIKTSPIRLVY